MKLPMLWKNCKRRRLKALFCTEWSPWKTDNVPLKVVEKSLNYLFKEGYEPWITMTRLICRVASTVNAF